VLGRQVSIASGDQSSYFGCALSTTPLGRRPVTAIDERVLGGAVFVVMGVADAAGQFDLGHDLPLDLAESRIGVAARILPDDVADIGSVARVGRDRAAAAIDVVLARGGRSSRRS
jgi:hypothetical protein